MILLENFGVSQIDYLACILMQHYIGSVNVPMDGLHLMQSFEAIQNLFQKASGFILT